MKTFTSFIIEADELVPERTKPIQSSLPGLGKKSIEKKYQVTNKPDVPAKYSQVDPEQALMNYATEVETRGVAGGRRTPDQVKLSPEEIKNRTAEVKDTFAAAKKGDAAAVERLKKYQAGYDKKYGVPEVEQSKPNEYIRKQQEAGIRVDDDLVDARGVAQSGKPEMVGQRAPSGQGAKYRAASDAKSAGVLDAGKPTPAPKPDIRTDSLGDAIRNVPDEPQLPKVKVTGGVDRPTDLASRTGMSQADFRKQVVNRRGRRISNMPDAPVQGRASIPLPSPTRSQTVKTVQTALNRNATQQGAATVVNAQQPANAWQRYIKSNPTAQRVVGGLKWGGRALAALSAIQDYKSGVEDAKAAGAGPVRQTLRGVTRAAGGFGGGLLGGTVGAGVGTLKGAIGGPLAIATGTAGALYGGAQGASLGSSSADAVFRTLGGETKQQVSQKDAAARARQINQGIGQSYSYGTGDTAIIRGADGKERVGQRSTSNGTTVYTAPYRPETNPIDRIGRNIPFLKGYYQRTDDAERKARVKKQKTKFYDSIGSQPSNNYKLPSIPADGSGTGP